MITIIFPYKNREYERVKKSLDSLTSQTNQDFKVLFVDYGSNQEIAVEIKKLVLQYSFTDYIYNFSELQPWSRAKALNIGLKKAITDYIFTADIDLIFRPDFISKLYEIKDPSKIYYLKVGFLSKTETQKNKNFEDYLIEFNSEIGAQGLSLFSRKEVSKINGYDEFLHFWGAEDIDLHNRLERSGLQSIFYNNEILLLHQWHKSYRKGEETRLTVDLQLTNITKINHRHLLQNDHYKIREVNNKDWGNRISIEEFNGLKNSNDEIVLSNKVEVITHFLFCELPSVKNQFIAVKIVEDIFQHTLKYKLKKLFGKKVPQYYSLKHINDMLLLHIISFYHMFPYTYNVDSDLKSITFRIKK